MYVDALIDRDKDIIHVVERVKGKREFREYPARYLFYYKDTRGKYESILITFHVRKIFLLHILKQHFQIKATYF